MKGEGEVSAGQNLDICNGNAPSFSQDDDNTVEESDISAVDFSGRTPVRFGDVDFVGSGVTFFGIFFRVLGATYVNG